MAYLGYSVHNGVAWGVLGGVVGAAVFCAITYTFPVAGEPIFVQLFMRLGPVTATISGWVVFLVGGIAIGAIFGEVVSYYEKIHVSTYERGVVMGVLAGVIVCAWLFIPVIVGIMPYIATQYWWALAYGFGGLLIFGAIMGAITSFGTRRIIKAKRLSNDQQAAQPAPTQQASS